MDNHFIYTDNKLLPSNHSMISFKDPGLLFGFGLFETLKINNYKPLMLEAHLRRMASCALTLDIQMPPAKDIEEKIYSFIQNMNLQNAVLRLTITKGEEGPSIIFTTRPITYTSADYKKGFTLKVVSIRRNSTSPLTYMKTLNYMDNILAKKEANSFGYDEALLLNTNNILSECSSSNIFFIKNNKVYTPSVTCGLLNGTIRELIIKELAPKCGFNVIEGEYTLDDLFLADEIFITNSIMEIMPVTKIHNTITINKVVGNNTLKLHKELSQYFA